MKFLKYLLLALPAIGSIRAMEMPPQPAQSLEIIDGKGKKCTIDPLLFQHSKTLQHFVGDKLVNFSDDTRIPLWLTADHLALITKALHFKDFEPFWQKLTVAQLHDLHKTEDYLDVDILCDKITQNLQKRDPEAFKPYLSMEEEGISDNQDIASSDTIAHKNPIFDATLVNHQHAASVKQLAKLPNIYRFEDGTIDLSGKGLRKLNGLTGMSVLQKYFCNMLDLSCNNFEILDLDKIFHAFPSLKILKAEHCHIKKLKGKNALPKGVMLLLAHNEISDIDESILHLTKECYLDLGHNQLLPEKIAALQNITDKKSLLETIRLRLADGLLDGNINPYHRVFKPSVNLALSLSPFVFTIPSAFILLNVLMLSDGPLPARLAIFFGGNHLQQKLMIFLFQTGYPAIQSYLRNPFPSSYLAASNQKPFATINSDHLLCAARKINDVVEKDSNNGLQVLLKK